MSAPLNTDTRETYVERMAVGHLCLAESFYKLGLDRSMWQQLFNYAVTEDVYGTHWDKLKDQI